MNAQTEPQKISKIKIAAYQKTIKEMNIQFTGCDKMYLTKLQYSRYKIDSYNPVID